MEDGDKLAVALTAGRAEVKGSLILVRFEQQEVVDTDLIVRGLAGEVSVEENKWFPSGIVGQQPALLLQSA